ncbi:MAG: YdiU family protein [Asticcacaulis sp.]
MPSLRAYHPDPLLSRSGIDMFDVVEAADFPQTVLRYRNNGAAASTGLDNLTDAEWLAHFGRFAPLPDNQPQPLALRYHGHQFRQYNPDLGDGRGFLFAQLRDDQGRLLDLGTKGSGQTPWSRGGDGRLTLKGGVREVLATALLEALGVNTSKSFSLIETGEALQRHDEPSPTRGAVLVRLSHSHIRFGTFERMAYLNQAEEMTRLIRFVADTYYPDLSAHDGAALSAALFDQVVSKTAELCAQWMCAGFVHGVLNTDNMNITGESFDYGPYRFLPHYQPDFTAAYFDRTGLYAYGRQPEAVFWNLNRLAQCFLLTCEDKPLIASLETFGERFETAMNGAFLRRLNLNSRDNESDTALVAAGFKGLAHLSPDGGFEGFFFDWFGGSLSEARALNGPRKGFYQGEAFAPFRTLLKPYEAVDATRLTHAVFAQPEPVTLIYEEIEALWTPIAEADDWSQFEQKLAKIDNYRQALNL